MSEYFDEIEDGSEGMTVTSSDFDVGKRADAFLAERTDLSRSAIAKCMETGRVLRNGSPVTKKDKVRGGDVFSITLPPPELSEAVPQDIPVEIVFEDEDILVVNKPKGMVVHPAAGNPDGTLVNALLYHCKDRLSGVGGVLRPGIVHRIDKDTEGLLVVAKNDFAHQFLSEELKTHRVRRVYYAFAIGNFREDGGTVDAPLGRHPVDRKKMAVIRDPARRSREAVTHWSVVERFGQFTLIRCELETGRTHQIRVHMASIGHPLLGDELYGGGGTAFEAKHKRLIRGQCLVATELTLCHPTIKEEMTFRIPFPKEFEAIAEILRKE